MHPLPAVPAPHTQIAVAALSGILHHPRNRPSHIHFPLHRQVICQDIRNRHILHGTACLLPMPARQTHASTDSRTTALHKALGNRRQRSVRPPPTHAHLSAEKSTQVSLPYPLTCADSPDNKRKMPHLLPRQCDNRLGTCFFLSHLSPSVSATSLLVPRSPESRQYQSFFWQLPQLFPPSLSASAFHPVAAVQGVWMVPQMMHLPADIQALESHIPSRSHA